MKGIVTKIKAEDLSPILRSRPPQGHKGTFGHALLVCGSRGMAGAAILAAEACLRSGIGKLSIMTEEDNRVILQITVPEAIVVQGDYDPTFHYEATGIGPGCGNNYTTLFACLKYASQPMIFDADAINMLGEKVEWQQYIPQNSILTPHPKEAERLTGSCRLANVAAYAIQRKVFVVLKGHPTHVCTPTGDIYEMNVGNAGMATAGSGDVLTGLITGLMAQGYTPKEAALLGVWLHGTAGDYAAQELTEYCMLARDIIHHLPQAFNKLKKGSCSF